MTISKFSKDTIYEGLQEGEVIELAVEALSYGGDGVGKHQGLTVFVPRAMPNEIHEVQITSRKKKYARGHSKRLITQNSQRLSPKCSYFKTCGGCHYQHIPYDLSLDSKVDHLKNLLQRIGGIANPPILPSVQAHQTYDYRNKMTLHRREHAQGYTQFTDYSIQDIETCVTVQSLIQECWKALKPWLQNFSPKSIPSIVIRSTTENQIALIFSCPVKQAPKNELLNLCKTLATKVSAPLSAGLSLFDESKAQEFPIYEHLFGEEHLSERVNHQVYTVFPDSFFQVNPEITQKLHQELISAIVEIKPTRVLDLYCGVGLFALALAAKGIPVYAIESNRRAIDAAQIQAKKDKFKQVTFRVGKVEKMFRKLIVEGERADVVIVDPPRSGLAEHVPQELSNMGAKHVFYVSCSPSTLARDLKTFIQLGYTLKSVQAFDMFPQTYHIEALAILYKK